MADKTNPLHKLLVGEEAISRQADQILTEVMLPYVSITKSSHEVQFTREGSLLKNGSKILMLLAAHLAIKRLELVGDETMSQKELITALAPEGVAEGSVKSALNQLRAKKLVSRTPDARYFLGMDKLKKLQAELAGGQK